MLVSLFCQIELAMKLILKQRLADDKQPQKMKTIKFLNEAINLMTTNGTPANINIGTFEIKSKGDLHFWAGRTGTFDDYSLLFDIVFTTQHIQLLIEMGVRLNFKTIRTDMSDRSPFYKTGKAAIKNGRYYQRTGCVAENWLRASATCSISTLTQLDKLCRDNHLGEIAIHNDTVLAKAGIEMGKKYFSATKIDEKISSFGKMIRKNIHIKRLDTINGTGMLPIEVRAMNKNYNY